MDSPGGFSFQLRAHFREKKSPPRTLLLNNGCKGGIVSLEFLLKFAGVFLGVLARTLIPWLRKLRDGEAAGFNRRYLYSTLGALVIGLILTLVIFPQLRIEGGAPTFEACFKLFCLAFGFGFGWNGIVLEGGQWAGAFGFRPGTPIRGPRREKWRNHAQEHD
jgi:hypothetical protein